MSASTKDLAALQAEFSNVLNRVAMFTEGALGIQIASCEEDGAEQRERLACAMEAALYAVRAEVVAALDLLAAQSADQNRQPEEQADER